MTGSLPPTGKTPRTAGNPWSSAGPGAKWWRGEADGPATVPARTVPPAYGGEAEHPAADPDLLAAHGATAGPGAVEGPGAAPGTDAVDGHEDEEPDRYDEPTVDVLAEQEAARSAQAAAESGQAAAESAQVEAPAGAGPDGTASDQPDRKAPAAADQPRLAKLREAPHSEVGPERTPGYVHSDGPADVTRHEPGGPDQSGPHQDDPDRHGAGRPTVGVPDVMILPEPGRGRGREQQTVALPRGPVPGQSRPAQATPEPSQAASKLETSSFWLLGDETDESRVQDGSGWFRAEGRGPVEPASRLGVPPRRRDRPRPPRRPATGLLGLLVLGLAAMFFAWVSAGPFWLAVGHGNRGTATVVRCTGDGVGQRCVGQFTADRGTFTAQRVALMGVAGDQREQGAVVPARMVDQQARQAYVGSTPLLLHLRWALGVLLLVLCGLGIAALTGARRLETARARRGAVLLSLAGPLALWAGFLAITY